MSVRIAPCYRCPLREGCEQRNEFRRRVAGLGLRSAAFPCGKLSAEMRPGRRIVIMQPIAIHDGGPDGWTVEKREVPATITSAKGHRFACVVDLAAIGEVEFVGDDEAKKRFRRTQAHYRILRFLDEPDALVCRNGNVQRDGACDRLGDCRCAEDDRIAREFGEGAGR